MVQHSKRHCTRSEAKVPIFIRATRDFAGFLKDNTYYTHALMLNRSKNGVYFELQYALQPGEDICLKIPETSPGAGPCPQTHPTHTAKVKWCRRIAGTADYGIGVQLME